VLLADVRLLGDPAAGRKHLRLVALLDLAAAVGADEPGGFNDLARLRRLAFARQAQAAPQQIAFEDEKVTAVRARHMPAAAISE
jgi:hypothetical protein